MSILDELRATVDELQHVIAQIHVEASRMGTQPYAMRDVNGGFVLASPLTALANAQVALAQHAP